jgi:hypothetical protein
MTKREALRQAQQEATLLDLGFTRVEAEQLRRISLTLHRWFEHECNGAIQRDGDDGEGKPFWYNTETGRKYGAVSDREAGARKRLDAIIGARNARVKPADGQTRIDPVSAYIQGDPRGAVLYILRPGDVPEGKDVQAYYTRGICVY